MGREGEKRGHEEETKNEEVNQQAVRLSFLLPHTCWLRCHCYHSSAHWFQSNCWHRSCPSSAVVVVVWKGVVTGLCLSRGN